MIKNLCLTPEGLPLGNGGSFFQLLIPAPSWAQPLAGRICHVAPEKLAKHP